MRNTEPGYRKRSLLMDLEAAARRPTQPSTAAPQPFTRKRRVWVAALLFVLFELLVITVAMTL